jgi:hypothetical protein
MRNIIYAFLLLLTLSSNGYSQTVWVPLQQVTMIQQQQVVVPQIVPVVVPVVYYHYIYYPQPYYYQYYPCYRWFSCSLAKY